jgi:hypothetical protein
LAARRDELLQGVDAVTGEGERPVLVGDAQHENATILVGHLLRRYRRAFTLTCSQSLR